MKRIQNKIRIVSTLICLSLSVVVTYAAGWTRICSAKSDHIQGLAGAVECRNVPYCKGVANIFASCNVIDETTTVYCYYEGTDYIASLDHTRGVRQHIGHKIN